MITQSIIAFLITLIVAPVAFWIFSKTLKLPEDAKHFPTGSTDAYGDIIFLPLFNAIAVYLGMFTTPLKLIPLAIGIIFGIMLASSYTYWRVFKAKHNDWSRPKKNHINVGGWYHYGYMIIQASIIGYGLILFFNKWLIWVPIVGYLITVSYRFIVQLDFFKK